jgi:hypothetical protein
MIAVPNLTKLDSSRDAVAFNDSPQTGRDQNVEPASSSVRIVLFATVRGKPFSQGSYPRTYLRRNYL